MLRSYSFLFQVQHILQPLQYFT
uniref:Uncharacterized protein n=1 Tax=Anguilla anguilla TaxID=7936 RepID=A0A0E9RFW3_ANGAN